MQHPYRTPPTPEPTARPVPIHRIIAIAQGVGASVALLTSMMIAAGLQAVAIQVGCFTGAAVALVSDIALVYLAYRL